MSQCVDSVSSHQTEPKNGTLEFSINRMQYLSSFQKSDASIAFHLYKGNAESFHYSLAIDSLRNNPLPQFSTFSLKTEEGNPHASLLAEVIPSHVLSSCESSHQVLAATGLQYNRSARTDQAIPVQIQSASLLLPKSPLFLHITPTEYCLKAADSVILSIPFATIEKSECTQRTIIERGFATGLVRIVFNGSKAASDWVLLRVTFQEDHPVWRLFDTTPRIDAHKEYRCVRSVKGANNESTPWMEMESLKENKLFFNQETGRYVTAIPRQKTVKVGVVEWRERKLDFDVIEELRMVELVCCASVRDPWQEPTNDRIVVSAVHSKRLKQTVGVGYELVSVSR